MSKRNIVWVACAAALVFASVTASVYAGGSPVEKTMGGAAGRALPVRGGPPADAVAAPRAGPTCRAGGRARTRSRA